MLIQVVEHNSAETYVGKQQLSPGAAAVDWTGGVVMASTRARQADACAAAPHMAQPHTLISQNRHTGLTPYKPCTLTAPERVPRPQPGMRPSRAAVAG